MLLSINDLCLIPPEGSRKLALQNSIELAIKGEEMGFQRVWYAEHHASNYFSSCAPEVILPVVAAYTSTIKLGTGSILLNYHNPFRIAETFLMLSSYFPGRIDLGVGKSSAGPLLDRALDFQSRGHKEEFERVVQLLAWLENGFATEDPFSSLPIGNVKSRPEFFLTGSSPSSALCAAQLSTAYVFADFFAPALSRQSLKIYLDSFQPKKEPCRREEPYAILAVRVLCAETEEEVKRLLSPLVVMEAELRKNKFRNILSPEEAIKSLGRLPDLNSIADSRNFLSDMIIGTPDQVQNKIQEKIALLPIREIIIQDLIPDHQSRLNNYKLLAKIFNLPANVNMPDTTEVAE